jgi:hypothetical protein
VVGAKLQYVICELTLPRLKFYLNSLEHGASRL